MIDLEKLMYRRTLKKRIVSLLGILLFLVCRSANPAYPAENGSLVATLSSPTVSIAAGEPVIISYEVENISYKPILLPAHFFSPGSIDGTGLFFTVVGDNGIPLTSQCKPGHPEFPDATVEILPGEFHGRKSFNIAECFQFTEQGEYSIAAQFSSASAKQYVWKGSISSNSVKIKVKESDARKRAKIADALLSQWLANYESSVPLEMKRKVVSLGTPATIAIAYALKYEKRLLPVDDLLEMLGTLPCREAADALIDFINTAPSRQFTSNMPAGFSPSSILMETAYRSLERIFAKAFKGEENDIAALWNEWVNKHSNTLPPAMPVGTSEAPAPSTKQTYEKTIPIVPYPDDSKKSEKLTRPKNGGKIK